MLDIEVSPEVADAIAEIGRKDKGTNECLAKPLTREDCTTPELRLEYIAQWLEAGGEARYEVKGFEMNTWGHCGTVCCIAGSAEVFFRDTHLRAAARILGMNYRQANELFWLQGAPDEYFLEITPVWAARCIRHYQKTGVVDWEGTR
jgi:hypothetical protein